MANTVCVSFVRNEGQDLFFVLKDLQANKYLTTSPEGKSAWVDTPPVPTKMARGQGVESTVLTAMFTVDSSVLPVGDCYVLQIFTTDGTNRKVFDLCPVVPEFSPDRLTPYASGIAVMFSAKS